MTGQTSDPVFAVAADPHRMRSVLAEHLRAADGTPVTVDACDVAFARAGSGTRSLFQYRVTLTKAPASPVTVTAVTYGGGRTARAWRRVRGAAPVNTDAGVALAAVAYVPDLDLLLQVFPFDHQLPTLARLLAGPWPELTDRLLPAFGPGAWRVTGWYPSVERYRVDLRATIRLTMLATTGGAGDTAERIFYAKAHGNADQADSAAASHRALEAVLRDHHLLAVAPVAAWLPEERLLVYHAVPGRSAVDAFAAAGTAADAAQRTGAALAALHRLPLAAPERRHELERTGPERVLRDAGRLRARWPGVARLAREVEASIVAGVSACDTLAGVPVHGDLKPAHVLLDGERVVLLDFDKFASGEPMVDIVGLARSLRQGRQVPLAEHTDATVAGLLDAYFAHVPDRWRIRFHPHYAAALLSEASRVGQSVRDETAGGRRREAGAARVEQLLEEARAVADGHGLRG